MSGSQLVSHLVEAPEDELARDGLPWENWEEDSLKELCDSKNYTSWKAISRVSLKSHTFIEALGYAQIGTRVLIKIRILTEDGAIDRCLQRQSCSSGMFCVEASVDAKGGYIGCKAPPPGTCSPMEPHSRGMSRTKVRGLTSIQFRKAK